MDKKKKALLVLSELKKVYGVQRTALQYRTVFELLVATILSAQCTDVRVNIVTKSLFKKYRSIKDFAGARQSELERDIFSTGFYRAKAKNIIATAKMVQKDFGGRVPKTMEELISLPGVARKTANIVLSSGFGVNDGIAVDTHVKRLSFRIGLTKQKRPEKIEFELLELVPKKEWSDFSLLLISHGRKVCGARKPLCEKCVLNEFCDSAFTF